MAWGASFATSPRRPARVTGSASAKAARSALPAPSARLARRAFRISFAAAPPTITMTRVTRIQPYLRSVA